MITDDASLPRVHEISHVNCQKALRMTLHQMEFETDLAWNTGLFAAASYYVHGAEANVFRIVHHDGSHQKSVATGVHSASHNAEVSNPSEEVTSPCTRLHGGYQMVEQIADVLELTVDVRLEIKHPEAPVIASHNDHHDMDEKLAENGVDQRVAIMVACHKMVA